MERHTWHLFGFRAAVFTVAVALGACTEKSGEDGANVGVTDADGQFDGAGPSDGANAPSDGAIAAIDAFIAENVDRDNPSWRFTLKRPPRLSFNESANYMLSMETNRGPVKIRLLPDLAPMHVSNAIYLARLGYYDGNSSHRAMKGFMVQAGSSNGRGGGSPGYGLKLEAGPTHVYDRPGLLAAARTNDPHSAGSQFFLMLAPYAPLNGKYTIYGELANDAKTESMMTLRAMEEVSNPGDGPPRQPIVFEKFTITVE